MVITEEEAGLRVVDNIVRYLKTIGRNITDRQARNYAQEISKIAKKIELYKNTHGFWCAKIANTEQTNKWRKFIVKKHKEKKVADASYEAQEKWSKAHSLKVDCEEIIKEFEENEAEKVLSEWSALDLVEDVDQQLDRFQKFFEEYSGTKAPPKEERDWITFQESFEKRIAEFCGAGYATNALCEIRRSSSKKEESNRLREEDISRRSVDLYKKIMGEE